jgi:hypothetical protein
MAGDHREAAFAWEPTGAGDTPRPSIQVRDAVKSFHGRVVVDVDDLVLGAYPIE